MYLSDETLLDLDYNSRNDSVRPTHISDVLSGISVDLDMLLQSKPNACRLSPKMW